MKNKAFTLAELLGTIVILAIIALIAFPAVLGLLNSSQQKTDSGLQNYAISAAREYVNDNMDLYPKALATATSEKTYGEEGKISIQKLIDEGYIDTTTINDKKNSQMLDDYIEVTSDSKKYNYKYVEVEGES